MSGRHLKINIPPMSIKLPPDARARAHGVIICPNPDCQRKIEEPLLLNDLSKTPAEQYYACPYCRAKLEDVIEESTLGPPIRPSSEKVLDAISTEPQKEKEEKKKKEELPVKPPEKEEKGLSRCPHHFGYLASRAKDAPIPQECLTCPKVLDCMTKISDS